MVKCFKNILILSISFALLTCKKKTTISVKVFNPALDEYVPNAVVSLMEIKDGNLFSQDACKEIATATTDANGVAYFDNEKLRTKNRYHYKVGIKESWGIAHQDPCGSQTQDYLNVGKSQEVQLSDHMETTVSVQYNNLLNPSITGDSLLVSITTVQYIDPMNGSTQGGGFNYSCNSTCGYPYPSTILYKNRQCYVGRNVVYLHKRKMGVVTDTSYIVKAYPNQSNIIQINW